MKLTRKIIAHHTAGLQGTENLGGDPQYLQRMQAAGGSTTTMQPAAKLTAALRKGEAQRAKNTWLGPRLMPDLNVDAWRIQLPIEDGGHLRVFDTEIGFDEERREAFFANALETHEMAQFGFKHGVPDRLLKVADSVWRLGLAAARRSQEAVELSKENLIARMLATPAFWPAAHRKDASGAPWNLVGGDMQADVDAGVTQLLSVNTASNEGDVHLALSRQAWQAAKKDRGWAASRSGIDWRRPTTTTDLELYLGLDPGRIIIGDAVVEDPDTKLSTHMWGATGTAFLYLVDNGEDEDDFFGGKFFAKLHRFNGGNAYPPWRTNDPPINYFPYDLDYLTVVHSYFRGFLIDGMLG
jgi:hypothetical protein